jgi:hypothetical protein
MTRVVHRIIFGCTVSLHLIALPTVISQAQDYDSAVKFLHQLYEPYARGKAPNPMGHLAQTLFEPGLLSLIRRQRIAAQGEVGLLDHDPICSCQDYDALTDIHVSTQLDGKRAHGSVSFVNGVRRATVQFELIGDRVHWQIYDIREADVPSLRAFLATGLSRSSKSSSPAR